jgi:hypothetical protein
MHARPDSVSGATILFFSAGCVHSPSQAFHSAKKMFSTSRKLAIVELFAASARPDGAADLDNHRCREAYRHYVLNSMWEALFSSNCGIKWRYCSRHAHSDSNNREHLKSHLG